MAERTHESVTGYSTKRLMKAKRSPSKRPLSVSLSFGMTGRAIKERIMKGELSFEPRFLAR